MTGGLRVFLIAACALVVGLLSIQLFDQSNGRRSTLAASVPAIDVPVELVSEPNLTPATIGPQPSTPPSPVAAETATPQPALPAELSGECPPGNHSAVVDRVRQSAWLCESGVAVHQFAFTGAISQPDPGTYPVYARDLDASSTTKAGTSTMTHFVAFSYGKFRGARIAFHSMPKWTNGEYVQPLDTLGDTSRRGESGGCLRVTPEDAVRVWDWLGNGDDVRVIN